MSNNSNKTIKNSDTSKGESKPYPPIVPEICKNNMDKPNLEKRIVNKKESR